MEVFTLTTCLFEPGTYASFLNKLIAFEPPQVVLPDASPPHFMVQAVEPEDAELAMVLPAKHSAPYSTPK